MYIFHIFWILIALIMLDIAIAIFLDIKNIERKKWWNIFFSIFLCIFFMTMLVTTFLFYSNNDKIYDVTSQELNLESVYIKHDNTIYAEISTEGSVQVHDINIDVNISEPKIIKYTNKMEIIKIFDTQIYSKEHGYTLLIPEDTKLTHFYLNEFGTDRLYFYKEGIGESDIIKGINIVIPEEYREYIE